MNPLWNRHTPFSRTRRIIPFPSHVVLHWTIFAAVHELYYSRLCETKMWTIWTAMSLKKENEKKENAYFKISNIWKKINYLHARVSF
jgi:hypothetical protein